MKVMGGSGRVKMSSSIVDYIFRELAIRYLGRHDLSHVSPEDLDPYSISRPEITEGGVVRNKGEVREVQQTLGAFNSEISIDGVGLEVKSRSVSNFDGVITDPPYSASKTRQLARENGFTGDICTDCGSSQMVRSGTCLKCTACGATTGCS